MSTQKEAFQNIVGINFADAVLNELRCAREALSKIETEDKELDKTLDHIAKHLDAAGSLSFLMKDYYGNRAGKEVDLHKEALAAFNESDLVQQMKNALELGAETSAEPLENLLKVLGLTMADIEKN